MINQQLLAFACSSLLAMACNTAPVEKDNQAGSVIYWPDSSQKVQELHQHFDSVSWERFVFDDLGFNLIVPANWGSCANKTALLCAIDSASLEAFKSNIVVTVYPSKDLDEFQSGMIKERSLVMKWSLVENTSNTYFWTKNSCTSYTTTQNHAGITYELGFWCFSFEHRGRVVEVTLAGLLKDVDRLDYLFKFITSRIERL